MTTTVTVFHNVATDYAGRPLGMLDGYAPGHPLVPVAQWPAADGVSVAQAAGLAFDVLNVGDDPEFRPDGPDARAVEYRARANRSMSVGDVVRIQNAAGDVWLACASFGWDTVQAPAWIARNASAYGTTPLPDGARLDEPSA
jgi:hypothetical protein